MKSAFLAFALVAIGSIANACPDLTGSYTCTDGAATTTPWDIVVTQATDAAGVTTYNGTLIANGVSRSQGSKQQGVWYDWKASCDGEVVLTEAVGKYIDKAGAEVDFAQSSKNYKDTNGNLVSEYYEGIPPVLAQTVTCTPK